MSDSDEENSDPEEVGEEEEQAGEEAVLEEEAKEFGQPVRKPRIYLSPRVSEHEMSVSLERLEGGLCLSVLGRVFDGGHHGYLKLNVSSHNLTDISIIPEKFRHIMFLDVSDNRLNEESLSCVFHMNIVSILASKNRFRTASWPIIEYLQVLDLNYNYIRSTENIIQPNLVSLSINHNQLKEIEGLDYLNLPELRNLEFRGNSLIDLTGIYFPALRHLYLADNFIESLVGIEHLVNLQILHLRDNPLSELDGFTTAMERLKYINIRKCELKELSQLHKLECLPALETLVLSENPFSSDAEEDYRVAVLVILPKLFKIDKNPVLEEELEEAIERREGELAGEGGDDDDDDDDEDD